MELLRHLVPQLEELIVGQETGSGNSSIPLSLYGYRRERPKPERVAPNGS